METKDFRCTNHQFGNTDNAVIISAWYIRSRLRCVCKFTENKIRKNAVPDVNEVEASSDGVWRFCRGGGGGGGGGGSTDRTLARMQFASRRRICAEKQVNSCLVFSLEHSETFYSQSLFAETRNRQLHGQIHCIDATSAEIDTEIIRQWRQRVATTPTSRMHANTVRRSTTIQRSNCDCTRRIAIESFLQMNSVLPGLVGCHFHEIEI